MADILTIAEHVQGRPTRLSLEVLAEGQRLAGKLGLGVSAVLVGSAGEDAARGLIECGADRAYVIDVPPLEQIDGAIAATLVARLIQERLPRLVLCPASTSSGELGARLAQRLSCPLVATYSDFVGESNGALVFRRLVSGGTVEATVRCVGSRAPIVMIASGLIDPAGPLATPPTEECARPEVIVPELRGLVPKLRSVEVRQGAPRTIDLRDAEVVVGVGLGIGRPEGIALAEELARLLGGALGATRAVVDRGWLPYDRQIGQSGRIVSPKVYLACGVSGALQHLAGLRDPELVVAINLDARAPIFGIADIGICRDLYDVMPMLVATLTHVRPAVPAS